jgi:hypothetical protein
MKYLIDKKLTDQNVLKVETLVDILDLEIKNDLITVGM